MATIRFIAFLFYRYYSTGPTKEIRYLSTLLALSLLFFIHFMQIWILFDLPDILPNGRRSELSTWIKMGLFMLPFYFVCRLAISESYLQNAEYPKEKIRKGNVWLIVYVIFSFSVLILIVLYNKGKI